MVFTMAMTNNNPKLTNLLKNGIITNANPRVKSLQETTTTTTTVQHQPQNVTNKQKTNQNNNTQQQQLHQHQLQTTNIPTPKSVSLKTDIRNIMHAFGDSSSPLNESVLLMENVLRLELKGFLYLCDSAAEITGSKTLTLKEAVYTMRNEKNRLLRLFKYFATKDQQLKMMRQNSVNSNKPIPKQSYMTEIASILIDMDESGEMMNLLTNEGGGITESSKTEKALRGDRIHLRSSLPNYVAYAKARSVSFARKLTVLHEWIRTNLRSEYRLSPSYLEVLAFLTYELIAHIVDLTFIVRRERLGFSNPITRLCDSRGANPNTCTSAPAFQLQKKRKDDEYNSVSEILVAASEMEAKRLKKTTSNVNEMTRISGALSLSPSEIAEAYRRFQAHSPALPSQSYKSRADRRFNLL